MTQAELDAGTAIVNTATVTGTGATPDTDDASVPVAQSKILHIEKDATVPGGTADAAGETISYTLAVTNQGNAAIAGVVVSDPFTTNEAPVLVGAFNVGDTDQDNLLDVGETWQYTASHTVTQAELDAGTAIVNTATVTGTGATSDSDDASVPVAQSKILHIEKDATVPGGTADVAGETISYTLAVTNQGNAAIAGVVVSDPFTTNEAPVLVGAFNVGDTDQDNLLDVGETWQYTASHTVTQAELDAGTAIVNTATVTGTGATPDTDDATVPVAQSKILHIEKDATVPGGTADVAGETISYTLAVTNQGNAAIAGVVVSDPFTTNEAPVLTGAFNVGDTDQDNLLDVGETWQYTASHTVTQAELDAGTAIVNTATVTGTGATPDSDDATVPVAQSKILHIEKDATVPGGTADVAGETISYTLAVTNQGNAAIAGVVVSDPFTTNEAPVLDGAFNVGDTDQDNLLDVGETWQYTASHTVTQAELRRRDGHRQHGDGDRHRGDLGHRRRHGAGGAEQDPAHREGRDGSGRHGRRGRRDDQLHAGGDQPGQCGDCRRGGERSVHDQRGAGAGRRLQCRRHRPGQSARCRRDLAVHGQPHGDAGRARRRDGHRQHGDGDRHRGDPGHATMPRCRWRRARSCTSRRTPRFRAARPTWPARRSATRWR